MNRLLLVLCLLPSVWIIRVFSKRHYENLRNCPGMGRFYADLGCIPIFGLISDRCPFQYNCTSLTYRKRNKCYLHGREYLVGRILIDADEEPGNTCHCVQENNRAHFVCHPLDCSIRYPKAGCYRRRNAIRACPGPEICLDDEQDRPICNVGGQIYKDGESFEIPSEPRRKCFCGPGYTGRNVSPFCTEPKEHCGVELSNGEDIVKGCIPVFESDDSSRTTCPLFLRCPKETDIILWNVGMKLNSAICYFSNYTMHYGDVLPPNDDCVMCYCQIGPVPNCHKLTKDRCEFYTVDSRYKHSRSSQTSPHIDFFED